MSKFITYSVRVLHKYPILKDTMYENLSYQEACDKFKYFVSCCLEFPELNVRCINIFKGKKSIKLFQNYGYGKV